MRNKIFYTREFVLEKIYFKNQKNNNAYFFSLLYFFINIFVF